MEQDLFFSLVTLSIYLVQSNGTEEKILCMKNEMREEFIFLITGSKIIIQDSYNLLSHILIIYLHEERDACIQHHNNITTLVL